jgi:interferon-induced GTP-binding protein Mx1
MSANDEGKIIRLHSLSAYILFLFVHTSFAMSSPIEDTPNNDSPIISPPEVDDVIDYVLPGNAALRSFMEELTASTHVSRYLDLPTICVMGDTSSGKSSLLSQLSMTELPSSQELTTKCPILLQMTQSDVEKAVVSIQWTQGKQEEEAYFETIQLSQDLSTQLPEAILKAQQHILQQSKKAVASDVVQVHLYGPSRLDLTLVDLPGIAKARGCDDDESLVQDIQTLMELYLQNPRSVILAVVPANVDFHNSSILALAQQVDPDTQRTIPVITKPDLIDKGAEQQVVDLLLGKKIPFQLGFHIIKGRGQASLDAKQSLEASIQEEEEFFNTQEPWKSLEDRGLFGTVQLRQKLGELQMTMIRATIPDILKEIHEKQQHAFLTLVSMGNLHQTMADKRRYYQDTCQFFLNNLKASLSGKGSTAKGKQPNASAAAKLHDACAVFLQAIGAGSLATIKTIVEGAQVLVTTPKGDIRGEVVHVEPNQFVCVDYVDEKDHTVDVLFDYVGYKSPELLEENDVWSDGSSNKVYIARKNNTFDLLKPIPLNRVRTDPSWLQAKIAENRTDDLACFLNIDIFKSIVSDFIDSDWRPHCSALVNQTSDFVLAAVAESLRPDDQPARFPKLQAIIKKQSSHAARALLLEAEKQVQAHLAMEKHPYTQDHILLENIASARWGGLKRELEVALRLDQEGVVFDTTAMQSIIDGVFERNRKKMVEQHMAEDMEIVLEAYGRVATKRVIDRTPMICWEVFRSLIPSIQDTLWNITDGQLDDAMQDTPEFIQKYKELTEELEEMNKALTIFQSLL